MIAKTRNQLLDLVLARDLNDPEQQMQDNSGGFVRDISQIERGGMFAAGATLKSTGVTF